MTPTVTAPAKPPFIGIKIAGLIIPAISLAQCKEFADQITQKALSVKKDESGSLIETDIEYRDRLLPIVIAAVQRNYPAMDADSLMVRLDINTFKHAFRAALGRTEETELVEGE